MKNKTTLLVMCQSFEGDSNRNELLIANEIDQQACIQVEIDCNSSEDNFGSENSDSS